MKSFLGMAIGAALALLVTTSTANATDTAQPQQKSLKALTERFCKGSTDQKACQNDLKNMLMIAAVTPAIVRNCEVNPGKDVAECAAANQDYEQLKTWSEEIENFPSH